MNVWDLIGLMQMNFKIWNDALASKDYSKVASLYSLFDLKSIPSGEVASSQHKQPTIEHFADFFRSLPTGTVIMDAVQSHGNDTYLHTGVCKFPGMQTVGGLLPVRARFAYMWRRFDSSWKITYHHSYALPAEEGGDSSDCAALAANWETGTISGRVQLLADRDQMCLASVEEN